MAIFAEDHPSEGVKVKRPSSVRFVNVEGFGSKPHHWFMTPLVTANWSEGWILTHLRKVKNPNLSLNCYKLMSDIIQTHPRKLFLQ